MKLRPGFGGHGGEERLAQAGFLADAEAAEVTFTDRSVGRSDAQGKRTNRERVEQAGERRGACPCVTDEEPNDDLTHDASQKWLFSLP